MAISQYVSLFVDNFSICLISTYTLVIQLLVGAITCKGLLLLTYFILQLHFYDHFEEVVKFPSFKIQVAQLLFYHVRRIQNNISDKYLK